MKTQPSPSIFREVADGIGCDIATIRAVFEVEAAGKFFNADGSIPRRFEPHHFPRGLWSRLGFSPGDRAPWRASLALSTQERQRQYAVAENIDPEAAAVASSWGAPQIMGFNHTPAGFRTALAMVDDMDDCADNQVRAFFNFIVAQGLDGALRAQDWFAFASGYNGTGQAEVYAGKLRSAYRRHSGGVSSPAILRLGSRGDRVAALQQALLSLGYLPGEDDVDAAYGPATQAAVRWFQRSHGLTADGIVGARTWTKLVEKTGERDDVETVAPPPADEPDELDLDMNKIVRTGGPILSGATGGGLLASLGEDAQLLLIGGVVVVGVIVAVAYLLPRLRRV